MNSLRIKFLGQTGFLFETAGTKILFDPYLSNSVQEKESAELARLLPIPIQPSDVSDADWVIVTHEHRDHCDIDTLLPISTASKNCRFIGPPNVVTILKEAGINANRIFTAECGVSLQLNTDWQVFPVPSAHPKIERGHQGRSRWLGYVIQLRHLTLYHAGDTSVDEEVINSVKNFGEIDIAFLPVNERNYFLDRRDIIGNMSIREAFQFAEEIGAKMVVPTHWDMFELNGVFKEEIELLYERLSPKFSLSFEPKVRF